MGSTKNWLGPLEDINRILRDNRVADYQSPNLSLGMRPVQFSTGLSRWVWEAQPESVLNPFGTVQGGYLALFVDDLFSTAIGSVLETGEWAMTAEMKLSYLRAVRPGPLEASARVIRRSKTLAFLEAAITAYEGKLAVAASSTWAISREA